MARMVVNASLDKYMKEFARFGNNEPEIAKKVVMAGAKPIANEMRSQLEKLPDDQFRKLKDGELFAGVPDAQRKDLLDNMGIAPTGVDNEGNTNTKIGFKGYGSFPSKKYPKGVPNALLARAVESGSSVRKKTPFVRISVNTKKTESVNEMEKAIKEEIKIYAL